MAAHNAAHPLKKSTVGESATRLATTRTLQGGFRASETRKEFL